MDYLQFGKYDNPRRKIADRYHSGEQFYADDANWLNERLLNRMNEGGLPTRLLYYPIRKQPYVRYDIPVINATPITFFPYSVVLPILFDANGNYAVTFPDGSAGLGVYLVLDGSGLPGNGMGRATFAVNFAWLRTDTSNHNLIQQYLSIGQGQPQRLMGPLPGNATISVDGNNANNSNSGFILTKEALPGEIYAMPVDYFKNFIVSGKQLVNQFLYSNSLQKMDVGNTTTITFAPIEFSGSYILKLNASLTAESEIDYDSHALVSMTVKKAGATIAALEKIHFVGGTTVKFEDEADEGNKVGYSEGMGLSAICNMDEGAALFQITISGTPDGGKWDISASLNRIGGYIA